MTHNDTITIPSLLPFRLFQRNLQALRWIDVVSHIIPVNTAAVELIAHHLLDPRPLQNAIPPADMLNMLGNAPGLIAMKHNAKLLRIMTYYIQSANHDEAVIVAERIRIDTRHLQRSIDTMSFPRSLFIKEAVRLHLAGEAAVSYFLMRQRVLCLYASNRPDLHAQLIHYI